MTRQFQETRTEAVVRFVRDALHTNRISETTFAMHVVERYHESVPAAGRIIQFRTEGDPFVCATANKQRLFRMLDPQFTDSRLPADLEEAIVNALPPTQFAACRRELARRYGLMDVEIPTAGDALRTVGQFTSALGAAMSAIAPIVADGSVDHADRPHIAEALHKIADLIAQGESLRHALLLATR
ncbi:hypothetical protein [Nevskia ramosa]|uniref:hypothetical protein n=1 Tax=Nevskia ramosa TaxID=64002 RepID=UPI003D099B75